MKAFAFKLAEASKQAKLPLTLYLFAAVLTAAALQGKEPLNRILTTSEADRIRASQLILPDHQCQWALAMCPSYATSCPSSGGQCINCVSFQTERTFCATVDELECRIPNPPPLVTSCPGQYPGQCIIQNGAWVCQSPVGQQPNGEPCTGTPTNLCRLDG